MAEAAITANITEANKITYGTKAGSPESCLIALGSLILMIILPIIIGSFQSANFFKKPGFTGKDLTGNWACALFLFVLNHIQLSEQHQNSNGLINLCFTGYFSYFAMTSLTSLLSYVSTPLMPGSIPKTKVIFNLTYHGLLCIATSTGIYVWYLLTKHWIVHDLIGLAFIVRGIELLQWPNFVTGYGILGGLTYFTYWIVGTRSGEVSGFTSSDAPFTRLAIPSDLLEAGLDANNFGTVGFGFILLPGVFIALVHRFENSLKRGTNRYFYLTIAAYVFGAVTSILLNVLHGQFFASLPYLTCLGTPFFLALLNGELKTMFKYDDYAVQELVHEVENMVEKGEKIVNKSPAISAQ